MTEVATSNEEFDTLHRARVGGSLKLDDQRDAAVQAVIDDLVGRSWMVSSRMGYILTPEGFRAHARLLDEWREANDIGALARTYERFLSVNSEVKAECSGWQTSSRDEVALYVVNDALLELLERVRPALRRAGKDIPRFAEYGDRLVAALTTARAGDARFVTDPTVDSFHTVWFECHEDYLLTLGRSREEEGSH